MEEILEKWSNLGFLTGLGYNKKINVANAFEIAAKILITERNITDRYKEIETITFPILRRIFQEVNDEIDIKIITKNVINILDKLNSKKDMFLNLNTFPELDVEAEFCAVFSESYKLDL